PGCPDGPSVIGHHPMRRRRAAPHRQADLRPFERGALASSNKPVAGRLMGALQAPEQAEYLRSQYGWRGLVRTPDISARMQMRQYLTGIRKAAQHDNSHAGI